MCQPKPELPPYSPYWSWGRHVHLQSTLISGVYNGLYPLFTPVIRERSIFSQADCWHGQLGRFFVIVQFHDDST
jgi:hypothetical protein